MTVQVRIDPDVAAQIDEHRGDRSRAGFVNDLLRETFALWDADVPVPEPPRQRRRSLSSTRTTMRVRPGVRQFGP